MIVEVKVFDPADLPIGGIQIVADQIVYITLHELCFIGSQSIIEPFRLTVVQRNQQFHFFGSSLPISMTWPKLKKIEWHLLPLIPPASKENTL